MFLGEASYPILYPSKDPYLITIILFTGTKKFCAHNLKLKKYHVIMHWNYLFC